MYTTQGHWVRHLWHSRPFGSRRDAAGFEAALKSNVLSGDVYNFDQVTELEFIPGSMFLESENWRRRREKWRGLGSSFRRFRPWG